MVNYIKLLSLLPAVLAVPYKRYENGTSSDVSSEYFNTTSTETVYDYTTIVLPSTTLVMPTSATRELSILSGYMDAEGISTITSYITKYQTLTSGDQTLTVPVTIATQAVVPAEEESSSAGCEAVTVTVTETETETETITAGAITDATASSDVNSEEEELIYSTIYLTSTLISSYPVEAEFTYSDITTTLTSYIEITSTITSSSETVISTKSGDHATASPSAIAPGFNGTYFNSTSSF